MRENLSLAKFAALAGLLLLLLACAARAEQTLPDFTAVYDLKREGITLGETSRTLRASGNGEFIYESITQPAGFLTWLFKERIEERSRWKYWQTRIRPLEYSYARSGTKERRVTLRFDWERNSVTTHIDSDIWRMPVPPDTHDKLVYQLAIMRDLGDGKTSLRYQIADGGKLKDYDFTILGKERLLTALGPMETVKIKRIADKRHTTVWCAPALRFLPVRLEQTDKDEGELSMHIQSVEWAQQ